MKKRLKESGLFDACKTYGDYINYACHHGGTLGPVSGSHRKIIGPKGSMPIKCNHLSHEPQAGLRRQYRIQMAAIGIQIV